MQQMVGIERRKNKQWERNPKGEEKKKEYLLVGVQKCKTILELSWNCVIVNVKNTVQKTIARD